MQAAGQGPEPGTGEPLASRIQKIGTGARWQEPPDRGQNSPPAAAGHKGRPNGHKRKAKDREGTASTTTRHREGTGPQYTIPPDSTIDTPDHAPPLAQTQKHQTATPAPETAGIYDRKAAGVNLSIAIYRKKHTANVVPGVAP